MTQWYYILLFSFKLAICSGIQNLGGKWLIGDETGKYVNLTAKVPGGIYSDLMDNKIIGDVLFGSNDTDTRWVAQNNWTYSRNFQVDENLLSCSIINVVFEGLDTFSSVFINGVEVGKSDNMFLRYIFNVKNALQIGTNTIEVKFISPIIVAKNLTSQQNYIIPPDCLPSIYNGECHANQIRKMQASFSWDWGPAFPSMGIWKEVYLEAFNSSVIRYLLVDYTDAPNDSWLVTVSTILSPTSGPKVEGTLIYELETDVSIIQQIVNVYEDNNSEEIKIETSFTIPKVIVRKWWPNGYGEPKLYTFSSKFQSGEETSFKTIKIGFRTIELVQESIGSGLSFYFRVNGVPIFAKGANEIPLDILPERGQDPKLISRILESAAAVNMNMLRVWGGGVYESDAFYQKTDELGILIWQDFMFACAMYPSYPQFLRNVKAEVSHQFKRLNTHPSIALWAANNENEIALMTNWYGTGNNLTLYKDDYIKLYIDTIGSELSNLSSAIFVSSSPSNGKESEKEHFLSTNPGNPLFGDVHFYNYLTDSVDAKTYPIPRFASEFGYQSLPDVQSWLTATDNVSDLDPKSDFMSHRQHHPLGFTEMNLLISYQLKLNGFKSDFYKTYIYYSQILQAMSIKFETEYYRSFMERVDEQGRGNTMGALYWQLNDVWVGPTWSGIDYTGKWKMLHYYAKDFFAPTIITGHLDISRQLKLFAVSEAVPLIDSSITVSAVVDIYNWSSLTPVATTQLNISLEFGKSVSITSIDTDMYLQSLGCGSLTEARRNCFFYLSLMSGSSVLAPHNAILVTSLKNSNILVTEVEFDVALVDNIGQKFEITLTVNGISLFIWLDSGEINGRFSENGFVQVTPTKKVVFVTEKVCSVSDLKSSLSLVHLNNKDYQ